MATHDIPTTLGTTFEVSDWMAKNSVYGDTCILHRDIERVDTYAMYPKGRTLQGPNPFKRDDFPSIFTELNDNVETVRTIAGQDAAGVWHGSRLIGIKLRGANGTGERFTTGKNEDNRGIWNDPNKPGAKLNTVTLCEISNFYGDGMQGAGGMLACMVHDIGRHMYTMHYDDAFMDLCVGYNCSRLYAFETPHVVHRAKITRNTFGGPGAGYESAPVNDWHFDDNHSVHADLVSQGGSIPDEVGLVAWHWNGNLSFTDGAPNTPRSKDVWLQRNRFDKPGSTHGYAMRITHADGVHVIGNAIPALGGKFAEILDCTNVENFSNHGGPQCVDQK